MKVTFIRKDSVLTVQYKTFISFIQTIGTYAIISVALIPDREIKMNRPRLICLPNSSTCVAGKNKSC